MSILSKLLNLVIPKSSRLTPKNEGPLKPLYAAKEDPGESDFRLMGSKLNSLRIVGTSHFQKELLKLAGGRKEYSANLRIRVILEEDPANAYDPNAVIITHRGQTLGYLAKQDAATYREALASHNLSGKKANASADIVGGWEDKLDTGIFGLRLRCDWPIRPDSKV